MCIVITPIPQKGDGGGCSVDDNEGEGSGANAEEFVFCDAVEDF